MPIIRDGHRKIWVFYGYRRTQGFFHNGKWLTATGDDHIDRRRGMLQRQSRRSVLAAVHHHLAPQKHANKANNLGKNVRPTDIPIAIVDMPDAPTQVGQGATHSEEKGDEIAPRMLLEYLVVISSLAWRWWHRSCWFFRIGIHNWPQSLKNRSAPRNCRRG